VAFSACCTLVLIMTEGAPCYVFFPPMRVRPYIRQVRGNNATSLLAAGYEDRRYESHKDDAVAPLIILSEANPKTWIIFYVCWQSAIE